MPVLKRAFLRLLDTCNLECAHCYSSCGPKAADRLPLDLAIDVARQLGECGVGHVHVEGGEALIYKGFWDVLAELNNGGIQPSITSNGLTVSRPTLTRLKDKVSWLTFSVDGHCADVHDQIRRRHGSFDRVVGAIRDSAGLGIPTKMISVIWKKSVDHVDEIVALAESLGVDELMLFACGRIGAATANWEELSCDYGSWHRYLHRVRELARSRPWLSFEVDRLRRTDLPAFIDRSYRPICTRTPRDTVTIDPRGDVFPCGYFIPVKKSLGNIRDAPLIDIVGREQDGERYSGACKNPWQEREDGIVELCKLYSVGAASLPA
jgi:MoaA/NifB/PqqE/SkfB family radical SAM enzyme